MVLTFKPNNAGGVCAYCMEPELLNCGHSPLMLVHNSGC